MRLWQKVAFSVCFWLCSTNVYCDLKQAMESYSSYNFGESFKEFSVLAEKGDAFSQFMLGTMYLDEKCVLGKSEEAYKSYLEDLNIEKSKSINGYFGNRWLLIAIRKETYGGCSEKNKSSNGLDIQKNDDNEAFSWLLKAANYGDTDAQFLVALMYLNGVGVAISDSSAFSWLSKLANNGHILSQYYLALFYQNGWGVGINYQETIKWLSSAAEQNNADAQFMLGNMYEQGNGVTKDLNKANEWYKKSADNNGSAAKVLLGIHPSQLFLAQNVQNSSKPRFPRESDLEEIIYKKLADAGDLNSILFIARMTKNEKDSYFLYKKAAELGSLNAQYRMWQLNIAGVEGVIEADIYSANKWLFMSANSGHELSQLTLASSYYDGEPSFGIIQDYEKSFYWYNKLLKVNNVSAINKIASMYMDGKGVIQDYNKALELYYKSATKGDLEATRQLGSVYLKVGQSLKSISTYESLAKKGDLRSQYMLGLLYQYGDELVKRDYMKSYIWFNIAASKGHELAIKSREEVIEKISKKQMIEAQAVSRRIINTITDYQSKCKSDNNLCQAILLDYNMREIYKRRRNP